jgi:hypothetical protein
MKSTLHKDRTVTPLQAKPKNGASVAPPASGLAFIDNASVQRKENKTGMPDQLKSGVESLSGIDMSDVKVHYNSSQPAQLNAHAYAQGHQIHIAPGQEKHLPHEAWHVVQQKLGRVKPTKQLKSSVSINDDAGLEKEADVMGNKAIQSPQVESTHLNTTNSNSKTIQGMFYEWNPDSETEDNRYIWHWGWVIPAMWAEKKDREGTQELHGGYGVWIRKGTQAHLSQLLTANEQISSIATQAQGVYQEINARLVSREQVVEQLNLTHEITKRYVDELGTALKTYAAVSIIGVALSVGAAAVAQHFLSLPGVPIAVKAAIDIAGVLYGAYVTYRWMKTDLMPVLARAALAGGNMLIWGSTIFSLLQEGLNGQWFHTVHIAALPLAITIEIIIRKIMARVEQMTVERHQGYGTA